jgi:hypothetical protein
VSKKVELTIGEGFSAGIVFGIGVKTGIEPDELGIGTFVIKEMCKSMKDSNGFNCGGFIFLMIILSIIITVVAIYTSINRFDDWKIGATIYGISFFIGALIVIKN